MLLNILQSTGQFPTVKNYPVQNVSSAKVENSWAKECTGLFYGETDKADMDPLAEAPSLYKAMSLQS